MTDKEVNDASYVEPLLDQLNAAAAHSWPMAPPTIPRMRSQTLLVTSSHRSTFLIYRFGSS